MTTKVPCPNTPCKGDGTMSRKSGETCLACFTFKYGRTEIKGNRYPCPKCDGTRSATASMCRTCSNKSSEAKSRCLPAMEKKASTTEDVKAALKKAFGSVMG